MENQDSHEIVKPGGETAVPVNGGWASCICRRAAVSLTK
jgi:hypothetical protein